MNKMKFKVMIQILNFTTILNLLIKKSFEELSLMTKRKLFMPIQIKRETISNQMI